jgi:heme a synthase
MGIKFIAKDQVSRAVKIWLIIGIVMVFMQVVIGGVTRLTGSGLSITTWDIVFGTIPPLNAAQWDEAFELYKSTPQYQKINQGMSMSEFKFIYFWEYFHRLWARTMGFVFLFPFLYFLLVGKLSKVLVKDLSIVIMLTVFVASLGWIMVASGLINRPWVNAYKLTFHLCVALIMFGYLLWTTFKVFSPQRLVINNVLLITGARLFLFILAIQIFLGGIMSGMKAGLYEWLLDTGSIINSR